MKNPWIDFWQNLETTPERESIWRMNIKYFIHATSPMMNYAGDDRILDIGCGPGYLAEALADRVQEYHGMDISRKYADFCREAYAKYKNVFVYALDENKYTDFSFLPKKYFTKIICLSVIQYYRNYQEIEKLLIEIGRIAQPNGLCLVADIPGKESRVRDLLSNLRSGIIHRNVLPTVKYLLGMKTKEYSRTHAQAGLLFIPEMQTVEIAQKLHLDFQVLKTQLTLNKSRYHLLIKF